jgi:hypothetical protein
MKTARHIALFIALIGTAVSSLGSSLEVTDPTVAGPTSSDVMKSLAHFDQNKIENPVLSPLDF